jgi:hypothetical protein
MQGSCLCGAVQYKVQGTLRSVVACHCNQCRKTSGHYVAATQTLTENLKVEGTSNLTWYASSSQAQRGFCKTCGSQLFWRENDSPHTSIMAGTIDGDTKLAMDRQLYPQSKGDYYALPEIASVDQSTL